MLASFAGTNRKRSLNKISLLNSRKFFAFNKKKKQQQFHIPLDRVTVCFTPKKKKKTKQM